MIGLYYSEYIKVSVQGTEQGEERWGVDLKGPIKNNHRVVMMNMQDKTGDTLSTGRRT